MNATTIEPQVRIEAYEHGWRARLAGCWRVLANPSSEEERHEWLAGWDDADDELRSL